MELKPNDTISALQSIWCSERSERTGSHLTFVSFNVFSVGVLGVSNYTQTVASWLTLNTPIIAVHGQWPARVATFDIGMFIGSGL